MMIVVVQHTPLDDDEHSSLESFDRNRPTYLIAIDGKIDAVPGKCLLLFFDEATGTGSILSMARVATPHSRGIPNTQHAL